MHCQRLTATALGRAWSAHGSAGWSERKVLTRMRRMRSRGLSLRAIVDKLNADGVPARGSRWHLTTVASLLRAKP